MDTELNYLYVYNLVFMYISFDSCFHISMLLNIWMNEHSGFKRIHEFILSKMRLNNEAQVIPSENQINDWEILIPDS